LEDNTTPLRSNHPVLSALKQELEKLTKDNKDLWQALGMMTTNVEALEDWLKEALTISGQIEFDTAQEIAEIFGFTLTEEVEMELTFKVSATFNVPIGFDHDSLAGDFGITENPLGVAEEYLENSHWELDDWNITS
jgi:DNA-directed RNA polymerase sigma subunit (sigma70/sigma32)